LVESILGRKMSKLSIRSSNMTIPFEPAETPS
jgi:hypothetical protein